MDSAPLPRPSPNRLARLAHWLAAAVVYGALMAAAALIGLKIGERGVDTRSLDYLLTAGLGAGIGFLGLGAVQRWLLPRRAAWRYPVAIILVAGATVAAISLVAFLQTDTPRDAVTLDLPAIIRVRMIVEPYAANIFIFLTIGMQPLLPQGLLPLLLAGIWLARRPAAPSAPPRH